MQEWDWKALIYLTATAFVVRLAFLHHPSVVIFDEVHFGGFAQKYLTGQFFLDLHPPLARLLVTLSAWVGGFDGKFTFYNIGADYLRPGVPYVTMRAFTGTLGALVIPMAYVTLRAMSIAEETSTAVSTMLIFENGLMTQSRLILLDSYLVFFTAMTAMFWVFFRRASTHPFTLAWKVSLFGMGASMALAASCKWVGLFLISGIGLFTIQDLWQILGDTSVPLKQVARHFWARVLALIVVPLMIYMATFYAHFALQTNFTHAANTMSIGYQQSLNGGASPACPKDLYYGSIIRLRQFKSTGPFLHSHPHMYPEGSKQQQITGYHHRDQNNLWIVRRPMVVNVTYVADPLPSEHKELVPLRHGDKIRLEHIATGRFLHSHPVEPPVSNKEHHYEVSAYGHHPSEFSDLNDNWTILITDSKGNPKDEPEEGKLGEPIHAMETTFRLTHQLLGCHLNTAGKLLPDWGFKQNEITCSREAKRSNAMWAFETNEHPLIDLSKAELVSYPKLGFWGKFVELNVRMWKSNAGLSADHPFASRPWTWVWLSRGLGFWNGNHIPDIERVHRLKEDIKNGLKPAQPPQQQEQPALAQVDENGNVIENPPVQQQQQPAAADEYQLTPQEQQEQTQLAQDLAKFKGQQIYLIGNPVFWWATSATLGVFIATLVLYRLACRRRLPLAKKIEGTIFGANLTVDKFGGFFFLQWMFHFLPFFPMQRQLFLHHYFPALYFAVLLFGLLLQTLLDLTVAGLGKLGWNWPKTRKSILFVVTAAVIITFLRFAPLGYGFNMNKTQCERLKWLPRWDFDCSQLPDPIGALQTTEASNE